MSITRVRYREGQRVTTADLRAEQEYRLGLAGRHHLSHHDWGIVRGLRVVGNHTGGFTLTPGVAIDGYGREIFLAAPADLDIPDQKLCWFILLYYCEYPEQVPPGRACRDEPAPRIAQRPKPSVSDRFVTPAPFDDLEDARAAGKPAGLRPWPVLVARVGLGCSDDPDAPLVDYSLTRYVRHRAAVVRSPTRRALLKLGLDNRTDIYHVLLSTADGGALVKRVGIDRDGMTHVWRPLVVSGPNAAGKVAITEHQLLQVTTMMPAGSGSRLRLSGEIDVASHVLSASLVSFGARLGGARPTLEAAHKIKVTRPLDATLRFPGGQAARFNLVDPITLAPVAIGHVRGRIKRRPGGDLEASPVHRFVIDLKPFDGKLTLVHADRAADPLTVACGDVDRSRADAGEPGTPVVQFRPAAAVTDDAGAREIYAVTTSAPTDLVPRTELRMSGGAEDKTDVSIRWSAGGWQTAPDAAAPAFIRRMQMDGARRIEILADNTSDAALDVKRTVYLPAIGKDDPLLPEMMSMAYVAGLRQLGRLATSTTIVLSSSATSATRGTTLKYDAEVHYPNEHVLRRSIETIRGTKGTGDLAFRSTIPEIVLTAGGSPKHFTIEIKNFRHSAQHVQIQVVLLVTESNAPKLAISNVLEIDVHS